MTMQFKEQLKKDCIAEDYSMCIEKKPVAVEGLKHLAARRLSNESDAAAVDGGDTHLVQ